LWLERNRCIFDSCSPSTQRVSIQISGMMKPTSSQVLKRTHNRIKKTPDFIMESVCWFDGATQNNGLLSGAGGLLKTIGSTTYRWTLNCGQGTNTRAELLGFVGIINLSTSVKYCTSTCPGGFKDCYRLDKPQLQFTSYQSYGLDDQD
jgi:hypothetical protein